MKLVSLFVVMASVSAILVGCGEPATSASEDDAFQKQLGEAAAKNTDKNPGKRGGGIAPPSGAKTGEGTPPPATGTAAPTDAKKPPATTTGG